MSEENKKELPGEFVEKMGDYGYFISYRSEYYLTPEEKAKFVAWKELKLKVERDKEELLGLLRKAVQTTLPRKFTPYMIDISNSYGTSVNFECRIEGMQVVDKVKPAPKVTSPEKEKELDIYQQLRRDHDLKHILNCGVLSKKEKRRVLGLPDAVEE